VAYHTPDGTEAALDVEQCRDSPNWDRRQEWQSSARTGTGLHYRKKYFSL